MNVYILRACFHYEGYNIIGVYTTRQGAEDAETEYKNNGGSYDYMEIDEYPVNS